MADQIRKACSYKQEKDIKPDLQLLQTCFSPQSVAQTVYNLEVLKRWLYSPIYHVG